MNTDRLNKMTKKELVMVIWRMVGWVGDDSDFWSEETTRKIFNMGVLDDE